MPPISSPADAGSGNAYRLRLAVARESASHEEFDSYARLDVSRNFLLPRERSDVTETLEISVDVGEPLRRRRGCLRLRWYAGNLRRPRPSRRRRRTECPVGRADSRCSAAPCVPRLRSYRRGSLPPARLCHRGELCLRTAPSGPFYPDCIRRRRPTPRVSAWSDNPDGVISASPPITRRKFRCRRT